MNIKPIVFYTDDDHDDLDIFKVAVSDIDIDLHLFRQSGEMLAEIQKGIIKPSIIFVDLNMPMISGYDVVEILRAYGITTPIVILSTASNALLINRVFNAGANFFITKPTSLNLLKAAVKHALNIDWNNFTPTIKEFSHKL